jgi:hypothetical protein
MKSFVKHESYYQCDCGYEVLLLRQYQDEIKGKKVPEPMVEIAICKQSADLQNWYQQLRWIWNIICNKEVWSDQIILNPDAARKLACNLLEFSEQFRKVKNEKKKS